MMLGSSAVANAGKDPKNLAGIKKDYISTQQQGIPVPYFAGQRLLGGQFLSPPYNQVTKNVTGQTGKGESGTVAHKYFIDWSLLWCVGGRRAVDAIFTIVNNSNVDWQNTAGLFFGAAEYLTITLHGTFRIYRGSLTQPVDALVFGTRGVLPVGADPRVPSTWPRDNSAGNSNPWGGHYDVHPAYPGSCYTVMKKWALGKNNETPPQLQLEARRGVPWFAGNTYTNTQLNTLGLNSDGRGVNLAGFIYDFATDPFFGMALSDADLRRTGFENTLAAFSDWRVSPYITELTDVKTTLVRALEYIDGFVRDYDGQLDIGFFKHDGITINDLPLLADDDLADEPDLDDDDFASSSTMYVVTYADRTQLFEDRTVVARDPAMLLRLGEQRFDQFDGGWVTDRDVAKRVATERRRLFRQ